MTRRKILLVEDEKITQALTGRTDPGLRQKVLEHGAVAFFPKPADRPRLLTAIRVALA